MLVDKQSELMSDLLFTVHQHGGDDVTWKPPIRANPNSDVKFFIKEIFFFFLTDKLEFSIKPFTVFQTVYLFKKIIHSKYTPQILTKGNRPSQNEDGPFFASATQASRR